MGPLVLNGGWAFFWRVRQPQDRGQTGSRYIWVFPKIGVSPNHPFVHRVFIIFTIHFGGKTHLFLETSIHMYININIYIYIPRAQMILVLIGISALF